jgi:hypothetical protein
LGHDEQGTLGVGDTSIHLAFLIRKNPQAHEFLHQVIGIILAIRLPHPYKDQQSPSYAPSNLLIYFHASFLYSLDNEAHICNYYDIVSLGEIMARGRRTQDTTTLRMALIGYEIEKNKIEEKIREVQSALGKIPASDGKVVRKRRTLSAAARRRIGAAQKRRWAELKKKAAKA